MNGKVLMSAVRPVCSILGTSAALFLVGSVACSPESDHAPQGPERLGQVATSISKSVEISALAVTGACANAAWHVLEASDNRVVLEMESYPLRLSEADKDIRDDCAASIKLAKKAGKAFAAEVSGSSFGITLGGRAGGGNDGPTYAWVSAGGTVDAHDTPSSCGAEQELRIESTAVGFLTAPLTDSAASAQVDIGKWTVTLSALDCDDAGVLPPPAEAELPADSGLTIKGVQLGGDCRETAKVNLAPDGRNFSIDFTNFAIGTGDTFADFVSSAVCAMRIDADVPAGYQYAVEAFDLQGTGSLPEFVEAYLTATVGNETDLTLQKMDGPLDAPLAVRARFPTTDRSFSRCGARTNDIFLSVLITQARLGPNSTVKIGLDRLGPVKLVLRPCGTEPPRIR